MYYRVMRGTRTGLDCLLKGKVELELSFSAGKYFQMNSPRRKKSAKCFPGRRGRLQIKPETRLSCPSAAAAPLLSH